MALHKQSAPINFSQGLDTKTDPKQVSLGKFLALRNSIFDKGGLLKKRNGYGTLPSLPDTTYTYLTTLNSNLTAIGPNIAAYSSGAGAWVSKGSIQPMEVNTLPLLRNNLTQIQCDAAIAPNGLICTVYTEQGTGSTVIKYVIADSLTGQNITAPAVIPVASGTVTGSARVFVVSNYFIIVFTNVIGGTSHLQYVAISSTNPTTVSTNTDIAAAYISATTLSWDAVVLEDKLYIAYNNTAGGQSVKVTYLNLNFIIATPITLVGAKSTIMSLAVDVTTVSRPVVYVNFYDLSATKGYSAAVDRNLNLLMAPVKVIASGTILNLTSSAQHGSCKIFYEVSNNYSYDSGIASHFINSVSITPSNVVFRSEFLNAAGTITASSGSGLVNGMVLVDNTTAANIAAGTTFTISGVTLTLSINTAGNSAAAPGDLMTTATLSAVTTICRSVGLASKSFIVDGVIYFLATYSSTYQPTYFLINGSQSLSSAPVISAKLAYQNGGGYLTLGLPNVSITNTNNAYVPYLFKDLIAAVNKDTNVPSGTQVNGIYSQTGINLGEFTIGADNIDTAEIGGDLQISGGFLWMYDGYLPVEQNFFVYPDNVEVTTATGSGGLVAQKYFYQVTYEWTDNQGNAFRSAPSIPVSITTTTASSTNTINVPMLRLTYKTANPVKIVVYRWSEAQQIYYQVTSITSPQLNVTTSDSVAIVDALADSAILGNNILYTNGGVLENVNAPATNVMTLFDNRLWTLDSEDRNLLWFSKQVIEATPVEMSDLLTFFVAPTTAAQGSTGNITAMAPMDDKLIIFKGNAIYYINGSGPDNTGANNQYSQPIFVTSTVGCSNQQSIVFMPNGLMFQSDKGIWLLGRDLSTQYIGAPVEEFNGSIVQSAVNVPETNQVRFTLDTGQTLMYDYYYSQWGTFVGVPAISSCIFEGLHTFINSYGAVYQETPGIYLDGSNPVNMYFTTSWLNLTGLQGYQRAYFFYILAQYLTPHKLNVSIAYDYNLSASQTSLISPTNSSATYGDTSPYGQLNYGGTSDLEQWRVFLSKQRCQAFQITVQEIYDSSFGIAAGAGFTMSGLNLIYGSKSSFVPIAAANSVG